MPEINPITGKPIVQTVGSSDQEINPITGTPIIPTKKSSFVGSSLADVQQFTVPKEDYESFIDYGSIMTPAFKPDWTEQRAQNQGRLEKLAKGLGNATTSLVFDTVKDASYLFDWEQVGNLAKGKEEEFTNWLADAMDSAKEATKLDVYRTKASQGFAPWSAGWIADALPTFTSSLAMIIPATGAVKGLSAAGKAIGGAKLLAKMGMPTAALEGVSGAVLSRYMENTMEAFGTAQQTYQEAIEKGATEEQAKAAAGEAGRKNWAANSVMFLQDIPQFMLLSKGFKGASNVLSKDGMKEIGKSFLSEAGEEFYQFTTDKETRRSALINNKVTPDDNTNFTERLLDYATDGDAWTAAFLGGLGGAAFGAYGVSQNNKQQAQFNGLLSAYKGVLTNDKTAYNRGQDGIFNQAITEAIANKKLDELEGAITTISNSAQRIEDNDEKEEILNNSRKIVENIKYAKSIQASVFNDESLTPELKKLKFVALLNQKTAQQRLNETISEVNRLSSEDVNLAADLQEYKKTKLAIEGLKAIPNMQERAKELQKNLTGVEKELLEAHPEFKTLDDLNKALIGINDDQLKQALANKEFESAIIETSKNILYGLTQEKQKEAFTEAIKRKKEESEREGKSTKQVPSEPTETQEVTEKIKYPVGALLLKKFNAEGENPYMTEEEVLRFDALVEKVINNPRTDISDRQRVQHGNAFLSNELDAIDLFIKARREGKTKQSFSDWRKDTRAEQEGRLKVEPTITSIADKITKGKTLTPEEEQFRQNNTEEVEKNLRKIKATETEETQKEALAEQNDEILLTNPVVNEDFESINTQSRPENIGFRGTRGKKKVSPFTIEAGPDNDSDTAATRYYRFVNKNFVPFGKAQVVTKLSAPKLFEEILDLDPNAKQWVLENPTKVNEGVWVVILDENNKPVLADQQGNISDKGKLVFGTVATVEALGERIIEKYPGTIGTLRKQLADFRAKATAATEPMFVNITNKSTGHAVFENTKQGVRQSHPVVGRIADKVSDIDLQIATSALKDNPKRGVLKNGQAADIGKLYAFNKEDNAVDLIPRTLNEVEQEKVFNLILQKLGVIERQSQTISEDLNKLIYFGMPKGAPTENTLGQVWKEGGYEKGIIFIGTERFNKASLSTPENQQKLRDFLKTKRVNVNTKYGFEDRFTDIFGVEHNSYKEYLLAGEQPLFGTDLVPLTEVQFRNQYYTYDQHIKDKEIKGTETRAKEGLKKRTPKELDRLKTLETNTGIPVSAEEKAWFKANLPNVNIEIIKGLIDNKSFGRFLSNGQVLLSDEATYGTLYHEAFHAVTQLYLTQKELNELYKETKEKTNAETNLQAEETLAEDFINYRKTGRVLGGRYKRNDIFRKLLNFLKDLFNVPASTIEDVYRRLDKGFYKSKPVVGLRLYPSLDRSRIAEEKGTAYEAEMLSTLNALYYDKLFKGDKTPSEATIRVSNQILNEIAEDLEKAYEAEENLNKAENIKFLYENLDELFQIFRQKSKATGINIKDIEESIEEKENEDNKETNDSAYQEANQKSAKASMSDHVWTLITSLKQYNKDGSLKEAPLTGLPLSVNPSKIYNFLLKQLAGLSTYEEIYNKVDELAYTHVDLIDLLEALGAPSATNNYKKFILQQQFRQDFGKNRMTSYKTILEADGNIYIVDANNENNAGRIKEKWQNNIYANTVQDKEGKIILNLDTVQFGENLTFLNSIGFTLSPETVLASKQEEKFNNAVNELQKYIQNHKGDITDLFKASKEEKEKNLDVVGNINYLASLEADNNPEQAELSFISTENKTVYSIGYNNAISRIKNIINNSQTINELYNRLPHLNTVSTEGSVWMKELFDDNGVKRKDRTLNIDLHDGLAADSEADSDFKQSTRKLTAGDKWVQEINSILNGKSSYIRASDKSSEHVVNINKFGKNKKLFIPIEDLKNLNNPELLKTFQNYFKSELKRVALNRVLGVGNDIDVFNKAGSKFTVFEDILKDKKSVNEAIEALKQEDLSQEELIQRVEELAPTFYPALDKDVETFFVKYSEQIRNDIKDLRINKDTGFSKDFKQYSLEQLTNAIAVNDFISSVEQTKLLIGDMAFYKDLFKRTAGLTGTKETASNSASVNTWLNNNFTRLDGKVENGEINVVVFEDSNQSLNQEILDEYIQVLVDSGHTKEEAQSILKAYTSMDEGDAQGWITLDEWRSAETRMGHEINLKAFDKAQKGLPLTKEEMQYFTVRKYQYAGPQKYNTLFAPAYHKFSLLPLLPSMVKGKNMQALLDNMTKNQVGYALFKSGSKVGTRVTNGKANKFYTDTNTGEINTADWQKQIVFYDFLGLQTVTNPPKETVIFGTQFRKLLFSNQFEEGKPLNKTTQKLEADYKKAIDKLVQIEKKKLIKELGINPKTYKSEDVKAIVKLLQQEAKDRNLADNLIDGLDWIEDSIMEGKFLLKYKFDAMVTKNKIDSMLMSLVNSRLIRQKITGDALIQVASSGFETKGNRKVGVNEALRGYRKDPKTGKTLPAEVMIPMSKEYEWLLDKYNGDLKELNSAIKSGREGKKALKLVAYRIPTQGFNSMEFFEIAEFLPTESSTSIVVPTTIVAKSGSDFDVDKLNVIKRSRGENADLKNEIMDIATDILSHPDNMAALITPNSSQSLKDIANEIRFIEHLNAKPDPELIKENFESPEAYNEAYKAKKQAYIESRETGLATNIRYTNQLKLSGKEGKIAQFTKFMTAKDMIGIAAIHNTHHILAQTHNLTIDKAQANINLPINKAEDGDISIAKLKDSENKHNISEIISQILTASVDAAKDPFMFDINMTMETLDVALYLARTGVPFETIGYFLAQPIVKEYINAITINKSGFLKVTSNDYYDNQIKGFVTEKYGKLPKDYKAQILTESDLKNNLYKNNQGSSEFKAQQLQILEDYLGYKEQAQKLSEAMRATNMDTAGVGKNLNTIQAKLDLIEKVKKEGFVKGIDKVLEESIVKTFNQLEFTKLAFGQFYYTQEPQFVKIKRELMDEINPFGDEAKDKLATLIENDLINFITQNYGYANITEVRSRLFRTADLQKKILQIKKEPQNQHEIALKNNLFFKELQVLLATKKRADNNIRTYTKRYDTFVANQLTEAFRELKELDPALAKDIMDLGIIQSGLNNSPITYLGLIPYEYYNDLVKSAFEKFNKQDDKKNGAELAKFKTLFFKNNGYYYNKKGLVKQGIPALGNGMYGKIYNLKTKIEEEIPDSEIDETGETEEIEYPEPQFSKTTKEKREDFNAPNWLKNGTAWADTEQEANAKYIDLKKIYPKVDKPIRLTTRWKIYVPSDQRVSEQFPGGKYPKPEESKGYQETEGRSKSDKLTKEEGFRILKDFTERLNVKGQFITKEKAKQLLGNKWQEGIKAFYWKGEVYLTYLNLDDLVHEFSHPFIEAISQENPELFNNIMKDIFSTPEGTDIENFVESEYSEDFINGKPTDKALKEIAVRALTVLAKNKVSKKSKSIFERLWEAFKNLFRKQNIDVSKLSPNTTLEELANIITSKKVNVKQEPPSEDIVEAKKGKIETEEDVVKSDVEKLTDKVKLFLEKKLAILKSKTTINKAEKEAQIKRTLASIKALSGVESINTFIEDAYEKIKQAESQFDNLIRVKEGIGRHEMIDKLAAFNDFANGYSILDEISKEDIEEFFNMPDKGIKEQGTFTTRDKLAYSILMRDRMKQRYLKQGIPLLADYLLEQKSDKIDKKSEQEIKVLRDRIQTIERGQLSEKKKLKRIAELEDRIEELSGFSLDKQKLVKQLQLATSDESALDFLFSPLISSDDAVLGLFAKAVKNELEKSRLLDIDFAKKMDKSYTEYAKKASNKDNPAKFNEGIYEELEIPVGKDDKGETIFIKKMGFVQKYDVTKYEKAKAKLFKEIGPKPIITEDSTSEEKLALKIWQKTVAKWFKENTQPKPQSEIDEIIKAKKSELRFGIITDEEYKEWENKVMSEYGDDVTFKHELAEPSNKYINQKWTKLYSEDGIPNSDKGKYHQFLLNEYLESQKDLPEAFRKGYILPSIQKEALERTQNQGIIEAIKTRAKESLFKQAYDTEYGIAGLTEKDAKYIPVFHTQHMDAKDVSLDLAASIMKFKSMTNRYKALNNISGEVALTKTVIANRSTIETSSTGRKMIDAFAKKMGYDEYIRKNGESFSQKHLDAFVDMIVYGEMQKSEELFGIDAGKLTNTLLNFSAITTIAADLLKATSNNIQGNIQMRIEASSKDYFDKKALLKGKAFYAKSIPNFLEDFGAISPKNLPTQLVELYDAIQGQFKDQYGRDVTGSLAKKLFRTNTLFFNQNAAEHEIQVSTLFAALEFKKVKTKEGKEISLLEAYKTYGIDKVFENTDFTEKDRLDLMNSLHALNKRMHGVYNEFDRGTAQRYSLGRLAIMYRKYLIPAYKKRWKKISADQELGGITEGYYRTFWNTFVRDLRDLKFNMIENWSTYSEFEKKQIQRTITEATFILTLAIAVAVLKGLGDDDEELKKNYAYNFLLYQTVRMRSETSSYINPVDAYRVLRSPSAMTTTLERGIRFTDQLLFTWDPDKLEYKRKTGVFDKGTNKSWAAFLKLIGLSGYNISPAEATQAFEGSITR